MKRSGNAIYSPSVSNNRRRFFKFGITEIAGALGLQSVFKEVTIWKLLL